MAQTTTLNGISYSIPDPGDTGWAPQLTSFIVAIAPGVLQKTGGLFSLTSELDFGPSFGIKSLYLKSRNSNPASTGIIRLNNTDNIAFRNFANSGDLSLGTNTSDQLTYNTIKLLTSGTVVNADIDPAAAIAYSKLNLSNSIVNADINAAAAIVYSKLSLTDSILNADINASAAITYSKLSLTNSILDADINATAAIDASKIANGLVSNTEFQYLDGVLSAIQPQIDAKATDTLVVHLAGTESITGSKTFTSAILASDGTVSNPSIAFSGDLDTGLRRVGTNQPSLVAGGIDKIFVDSSGDVQILGTTSSSSAPTGYVGEFVQSTFLNATSAASNVYGDFATLSLTAGDWDVTGTAQFQLNTGVGVTTVRLGISPNAGNTSAGLTFGINQFDQATPTSTNSTTITIANYRASLAGSATYYLKGLLTFSSGNPLLSGSIRARRVR